MKTILTKIVVLDYGFGNTGSIFNMLRKAGCINVIITNDEQAILNATHLIIPGVGNFGNAMKKLRELNLDKIIFQFAEQNKYILGICLGMQILGLSSEESDEPGLGLINFENIRFNPNGEFKVPHMGWNRTYSFRNNELTSGLEDSRFYFVHSYYANKVNRSDILFLTDYGNEFVSGVNRGNIYGVQFHPEKSHKYGIRLFSNFVGLSNLE
jgi:imidazole glycerol-phosphate synthase subunit HisH